MKTKTVSPPQPVQAGAHTPLPWYYRPEEPSIEAEHPTETGFFCTVADCGKSRTLTPEQMKANAQFICRAVNSHAELLEALRHIGEIAENCLHGETPMVATQTFASPIRNIRRLAFEAIATAEKGTNEND